MIKSISSIYGNTLLTSDNWIRSLKPAAWFASTEGVLDSNNTPCAFGGSVSVWTDKSGNGNHLSQNNNSYMPTYQASQLNGYPTIRFDGVNDHLFNLVGPTNTISNLTILIVFKSSSTTNYTRVIVLGPSGSGEDYNNVSRAVLDTGYAESPTPSWRWNSGTSAECAASISVGRPTPWGVYTARMENRNLRVGVNGGDITSTDLGTTNTGGVAGMLIGCSYANGINPTSYTFAGDIAEIIYFQRPISTSVIGIIAENLRLKYNI